MCQINVTFSPSRQRIKIIYKWSRDGNMRRKSSSRFALEFAKLVTRNVYNSLFTSKYFIRGEWQCVFLQLLVSNSWAINRNISSIMLWLQKVYFFRLISLTFQRQKVAKKVINNTLGRKFNFNKDTNIFYL